MSQHKSEEIRRYWRSIEVLEPTFKYLGLRKKLNLARVNSDLQEFVYSWLRRNQKELIIITKLREDHAMEFLPSRTLRVDPDCDYLPFGLLTLFPKLSSLRFLHFENIEILISTIKQLGGSFKAYSMTKASGIKEINDMKYRHLMALMDLTEHMKTIELTHLRDWSNRDKSFVIERGFGLVALTNIPSLRDPKILKKHKLKSDQWIFPKTSSAAQLTTYLTSQGLAALEHLGFGWDDKVVSDERVESLCNALKGSIFDRLRSFSLGIRTAVSLDNVLILLKSISIKWPGLRYLNIYSWYRVRIMKEDQLCEIIENFSSLETLMFNLIDCEPMTNRTPFPSTRSITRLCLGPIQPAILLLFPSLRNLIVRSVNASHLQLAPLATGVSCVNLESLDLNTLSFTKKQDRSNSDSFKCIDNACLGFRRLLRSLPKLRSLQVLALDLTDRIWIEILCNFINKECPHLERLTLKNTSGGRFKPVYFEQMISRLKYLAVGPWDLTSFISFSYLTTNSPKLRSFRISRESDIGYTDEIQSLIDWRLQRDPDFVVFDWCHPDLASIVWC